MCLLTNTPPCVHVLAALCLQVVYEVRYNLPAGFKCEHCVLQWHWLTGHNCW